MKKVALARKAKTPLEPRTLAQKGPCFNEPALKGLDFEPSRNTQRPFGH
jgi:hypothetical protein